MVGSSQNLSSSHKETSFVQVRLLTADWGLGRDTDGRDMGGQDAISVKVKLGRLSSMDLSEVDYCNSCCFKP
eukprot:12523847-Ditylum_brightwellii.AAC.1